jgi:DNA-directed RNA polymerase specialized sigma24 family protein
MIDRDELEHFCQAGPVTDKEREAIELTWIKGYGIRKAARELGISPSAVRDQLDGVRRKLRKEGHKLI